MKIELRFDGGFQTFELEVEEAAGKWIGITVEELKDKSPEEQERIVQEAVDKEYNHEEYNSWHKFTRRRGFSKAIQNTEDEEAFEDNPEPLMSEVMDDRIFRQDEIRHEEKQDYDAACKWIRKVLASKPEWAEAFIAVYIDRLSVKEYAGIIGDNENNISQKLRRAKKKLAEVWSERQI